MIITETRVIPEKTEAVPSRIQCDKCGAKSPKDAYSWRDGHSVVDKVTIQSESGYSYPDDWQVTTTSFDLCPDCFTNFLVPLLASHNVHPRTTETD